MPKLFKKPGSEVWHVDLRQLGGGRVSTGCTDYTAAVARSRTLQREAAQGLDEDTPRHLVGEALEHLLLVSNARSNHHGARAVHLARLLGHVNVNQLGLEGVAGYIKARLAENGQPIPPPPEHPDWKVRHQRVSKHTVAKELGTLFRALRLARKRGLFVGHVEDLAPDDFSAEYRPRERWLTVEEFQALLGVLQPHRQLWVAVAVYLGVRSGEVSGLCWEHINWATSEVQVHGTKTEGAHRPVPMPKPLGAILQPLRLDEHRNPRTGLVVGPWPNDSRDLNAACKRAGIPQCSPNDMRRTFASWLAQNNQSALVISKLLGQTTTKMAERVYAKLSREALAGAVSGLPKLPKRKKGAPPGPGLRPEGGAIRVPKGGV